MEVAGACIFALGLFVGSRPQPSVRAAQVLLGGGLGPFTLGMLSQRIGAVGAWKVIARSHHYEPPKGELIAKIRGSALFRRPYRGALYREGPAWEPRGVSDGGD